MAPPSCAEAEFNAGGQQKLSPVHINIKTFSKLKWLNGDSDRTLSTVIEEFRT